MSQNPIQNKLAYFSQGATYRTKKTEGDLSNRSIAFVGDDMSIATQGKIFGVRGVYPGICGNDQAASTTKVVTTSPPFPIDTNGRPLVGTTIAVHFAETDTSTAKPYLNVNGTGEYAIQYSAGTIASKASTSYTGYAGNYIYYWFDWDDSRETDKGRWVWLNRSTFQSNTDVEPGRLYGTAYKTGSVALYRNTLAGMTSGGYIESIVTSSSTGKTKTRNTHGFRLGQWYYNSSTTATSVAANTNITSNILWLWYTSAYVDCQYSFNSGKTLTGHLPIYLVGTVNSNDNLFYLDATWWTQTLPSTEDGKVYIDIGVAYDTYRFIFNGGMNAWEYKDGALRPYSYHRPAATVNDGTLTIKQNGNSRGTFTANQAGNSEADIISIVYGKYTSDGFKQGFPNLNNGWSYLSSPIELETGVLYIDVTTKKVYYYSGLGSTTTGLQEIFSPDLTTYENVQADWNETDDTSDAYIWNKPAIPTVGTLNTNNTSALTESSSESFSGSISLHKVSKTGSYNDLLNKPTIPTIPDHKTLDGVSLVGSTGDVDKIVFGKLNANGSFTRYEKVGNEWAMVNVPTNPTARILYVDVFTELSYYYDTVVSQYKLIGPNPDLSGFLTSETPLSMGAITGNGNAVTDINVSGHQITLTKGTTFLTASDITGKADKSAAIGSLSLSLNTTDYKITLTGTYVDGTPFTVSDVIDLPLESVVVSGSYDPSTKKVVLTLKNNSTVEFSIADLISGLQSEITSNNKLSADLVENGTTNKVYTATEQTKLSGIEAGAEVNVQPDWNQTNTSADDYVKNKPTLDGVTVTGALSKIVYGKKDSNGFVRGTRNNNGQGFTWFANNVTPEEHVLYIDITNYKGWYYEGGSYRQLHELNLSPYENVQADWNETDDSSDAYIWNKPTISTVGTLNTNNSTAQTANSSESFSGSISLHKVSKTGSYNDLNDKPNIPTVPTLKTLDGVSLTGNGDISKVVFGKLDNGNFYPGEKTSSGISPSTWAFSRTAVTPELRAVYIEVLTGVVYYYDGYSFLNIRPEKLDVFIEKDSSNVAGGGYTADHTFEEIYGVVSRGGIVTVNGICNLTYWDPGWYEGGYNTIMECEACNFTGVDYWASDTEEPYIITWDITPQDVIHRRIMAFEDKQDSIQIIDLT